MLDFQKCKHIKLRTIHIPLDTQSKQYNGQAQVSSCNLPRLCLGGLGMANTQPLLSVFLLYQVRNKRLLIHPQVPKKYVIKDYWFQP